MKKWSIVCLTACLLAACTGNDQPQRSPASRIEAGFFNGSWTYRSLLNDTAWQTDFDSLAFAAAIMDLQLAGKDSLTGMIHWNTTPVLQGLRISGHIYYNDSVACYALTGTGDSALGTAGWQYDYQGYVVPHWSFGVNQADVLVGSVARAKPHNGEPAGVVASTYMVRRSR
ncbi:MAG: hypothetical protein U0X40_04465 [Ferruginibacter sp.]